MTLRALLAEGRFRPALGFILVTAGLDVLAGSLVGPVLPRFLLQISHGGMTETAGLIGAVAMLFAIGQLLAGPVQGALSDQFGRRPIILVASFGLAASFLVMSWAPSVAWFLGAEAFAGLMAGGLTACFAYIADLPETEKRASRFGLLGAAVSAGMIAGPTLGGLLAGVSMRTPFLAAAVACGLNGLYGLLVLPESLPPDRRRRLRKHDFHILGVILGMWRDYPQLKLWAAGDFVIGFAAIGSSIFFSFYVTYRFGWTPQVIGLYSACIAVLNVAVQAGLVSWIIQRLGQMRALMVGLAIQTAGIFGLSLVSSDWGIGVVGSLMALGSFAGPARMAITSDFVKPGDQGRLSGTNRSVIGLAGVVGPAAFSGLFAWTLGNKHPGVVAGFPLQIAAWIILFGVFLTYIAARRAARAARVS